MHEHTFIQAIIRDIPNKDKVNGIEIELGELVGIEPEHLKEHLIKETSWNVNIVPTESKIICNNCSHKGRAKIKERLHDMVIFSCPECDSFTIEVLKGKDIKIKKVNYRE